MTDWQEDVYLRGNQCVSNMIDFGAIKLPEDWEFEAEANYVTLHHSCGNAMGGYVKFSWDWCSPLDACPGCKTPIPEVFPATYLRMLLTD